MKLMKNENGYALLMVMMLVLLFTTLGMGLLAMNINASKQFNMKEEQVKARHQAEMGILHYQSELEKTVKENTETLNCSILEPLLTQVNISPAASSKYELLENSDSTHSCIEKEETIEVYVRSISIADVEKQKSVDAIYFINNIGDSISGGTVNQPNIPVVPGKPVTTGEKLKEWNKDCDKDNGKECKDANEVIPEFTEIDVLPMKQNSLHFKDNLVLNKVDIDGGNGAVLKVDKNMYVSNEIFVQNHACIAVGKNLVVKNSLKAKNKLNLIVYWDAYLPSILEGTSSNNFIYVFGDIYIPSDFKLPYVSSHSFDIYVKGNVYSVKTDDTVTKISNPFKTLTSKKANQINKESCATSGLEKPKNPPATPGTPFWDIVEDPSISYN